MKFGSLSPRLAAHLLFWLGLAVLLALSVGFGWNMSAYTEYVNVARDGWQEPLTRHNIPLAVAWGAGFALAGGALWRIFCEFCYLKLQFLRASLDKTPDKTH